MRTKHFKNLITFLKKDNIKCATLINGGINQLRTDDKWSNESKCLFRELMKEGE